MKRVEDIASIPQDRLSETPPPPQSVKLGITGVCNFECTFCYTRDVFGKKGYVMSMDDRETILRKLRNVGVEEVGMFLWGESTSDKMLPDTIALAHELGFSNIFLTCNGSLATPERVKAYIENGLTSLKFSIFAKDADEFSLLTGMNAGFFEKVLGNIDKARDVRDSVEASTGNRCQLTASWIVLNRGREEEMGSVLERVGKAVDDVYSLASYNIDEGQLTQEQIDDGWTVTIGNPGTFRNPHPPVPCHILFNFPVINELGEMHVCAFHHGKNTHHFSVGSLLEHDFMDLWHGEKYREFRRAHIEAWENQDMNPALNTACRACLTPPTGLSGLLPGQKLFMPKS